MAESTSSSTFASAAMPSPGLRCLICRQLVTQPLCRCVECDGGSVPSPSSTSFCGHACLELHRAQTHAGSSPVTARLTPHCEFSSVQGDVLGLPSGILDQQKNTDEVRDLVGGGSGFGEKLLSEDDLKVILQILQQVRSPFTQLNYFYRCRLLHLLERCCIWWGHGGLTHPPLQKWLPRDDLQKQ